MIKLFMPYGKQKLVNKFFSIVIFLSLIFSSIYIAPVSAQSQHNISFVLIDSGSWNVNIDSSAFDTMSNYYTVLGGTVIGYQLVYHVTNTTIWEAWAARYSDGVWLGIPGGNTSSFWNGVCNFYDSNSDYVSIVPGACNANSINNHGVSVYSHNTGAYNFTSNVIGATYQARVYGQNWAPNGGTGEWWLYAIYDNYQITNTGYLDYIKQPEALAAYPWLTGAGQNIVIMDTGIDASLSKFSGRIVYQHDFVNNDATAEDTNGHGTMIAGIIADTCPACGLIVLKTYDPTTNLKWWWTDALDWTIANQQAYNIVAVLQTSFTVNAVPSFVKYRPVDKNFSIDSNTYEMARDSTFPLQIHTLTTAGVLVVTAAGDSNVTTPPGSPVTVFGYPSVTAPVAGAFDDLPVTSVFHDSGGSYSSLSGATASSITAGQLVPSAQRLEKLSQVAAPGANISTVTVGGSAISISSTDASAAIVAATVGLLQSAAVHRYDHRLHTLEMKNELILTGPRITDSYPAGTDNVTHIGGKYTVIDVKAAVDSVLDKTRVWHLGNYIVDGQMDTNTFFDNTGWGYWWSGHLFDHSNESTWKHGGSNTSPLCGNNYREMRLPILSSTYDSSLEPGFRSPNPTPPYYWSYINQEFVWEGGDMYVWFSSRVSKAEVKVQGYIIDPTGRKIVINSTPSSSTTNWRVDYANYIGAIPGKYQIEIRGYSDMLAGAGEFIGVDAVSVSEGGYWGCPMRSTPDNNLPSTVSQQSEKRPMIMWFSSGNLLAGDSHFMRGVPPPDVVAVAPANSGLIPGTLFAQAFPAQSSQWVMPGSDISAWRTGSPNVSVVNSGTSTASRIDSLEANLFGKLVKTDLFGNSVVVPSNTSVYGSEVESVLQYEKLVEVNSANAAGATANNGVAGNVANALAIADMVFNLYSTNYQNSVVMLENIDTGKVILPTMNWEGVPGTSWFRLYGNVKLEPGRYRLHYGFRGKPSQVAYVDRVCAGALGFIFSSDPDCVPTAMDIAAWQFDPAFQVSNIIATQSTAVYNSTASALNTSIASTGIARIYATQTALFTGGDLTLQAAATATQSVYDLQTPRAAATGTAFVQGFNATNTAIANNRATQSVAMATTIGQATLVVGTGIAVQTQNAIPGATLWAEPSQAAQLTKLAATQNVMQTQRVAQTQIQPTVNTIGTAYKQTQVVAATQVISTPSISSAQTATQSQSYVTIYQTQIAQQNNTNTTNLTQIAQLATTIANQQGTATAVSVAQPTLVVIQMTQQAQPLINSPEQPVITYDAICNHAQPTVNPTTWLGWVIDYNFCKLMTWFTWSPQNTSAITQIQTKTQEHEPFSSVTEIGYTFGYIQNFLVGITGTTGASCSTQPPDPRVVLSQAQGILLGDLRFETGHSYFDPVCDLPAGAIYGPFITKGICLAINLLCMTGLYQYLQWTVNTGCVIGLFQYIRLRIVDYFLV